MQRIITQPNIHWGSICDITQTANNIAALEHSQVLFFPTMAFQLETAEEVLLSPKLITGTNKNISYDYRSEKLGGYTGENHQLLQQFMQRFATQAKNFVLNLLPHYKTTLTIGRTSYRPVEIEGRVPQSIRKDDTRLHVDAFPSTPMQGKRILRLFSN